MIWYLLFPLRRTTRAPHIPATNPLRRFFTRHGRHVSRFAVSTLIISTTIATILIYPFPFLVTTDFINGASNLPHHVWTVARPLPYEYDAQTGPDIIMRSIWIHASYMQALNTDILSSALELQDELLGITEDFGPSRSLGAPLPEGQHVNLSPHQRDALHAVNGLTNQSWIFQSPLLYWNCSQNRILADTNILATVNDKKNQSTPANITLRHSIVFSGKRFEDRRLLAADALVITLLHLGDSPVGRQWENVAPSLPQKVGHKWDIYPSDGHVSASQLYEFTFRPISLKDYAFLIFVYGSTLLYFYLKSWEKLRALKSQIGLLIAVITQILFSLMASLTICAICNIDLSRSPRIVYPLVITAVGLENMFRIIDAVVKKPSEDISTSNRIGHAFGETAHVALASGLQNVLLLLGLSRFVSPGVYEICIFCIVAIVFDFFFHSTFFLSVLSFDVRRMELGDALAKESSRHNRNAAEIRSGSSWLKRVLQGNIALSTRIAGTVITIGFVLIAQWHFVGGEDLFQQIMRLCRGQDMKLNAKASKQSLLEDIHQARSPTSWLRLQDHDTANEVIRIIKPWAHSYIARVYEPLVFVKKGSDRMPHRKEPALLPAAYDFFHHQLYTFVVIIILVIAALRLLTSYLLLEDETKLHDKGTSDETPNLSIKSLSGGHTLDIALLAESPGGQVVSVGLDRVIRVWDIKDIDQSYSIPRTEPGYGDMFPVFAVALDEESKWLAVLSSARVAFWNLHTHSWGRLIRLKSLDWRHEAFFFDQSAPHQTPRLIIIWKDGTLTEIQATSDEENISFTICPKFVCARPLLNKDSRLWHPRLSILAVSRQGTVYFATRRESWESSDIFIRELVGIGTHQVVPLSPLPFSLVASAESVYLIDADEGEIVHIFHVERMKPRSLECVYSSHRLSTSKSIGLTFLTLCYTGADSGDCILHHFSPRNDEDAIYIRVDTDNKTNEWCKWEAAREEKKHVVNPGVWELASDGSAVGLRRRPQADFSPLRDMSERLRNRFSARDRLRDTFRCWEIWRVSIDDRTEADESLPLFNEDEADHLVISEIGPKVKVGLRSMAFAFGNVIKLVTVGGRERFEPVTDETSRESPVNVSGRRRKVGSVVRPTLGEANSQVYSLYKILQMCALENGFFRYEEVEVLTIEGNVHC
ncbi:Sterol regulatory element-binding cleavage-activating-like protein [Cladobotryum mycophilum]|uniref:Sterol regulatory element-binding protein cleavage-activating protein n=1 Tax=Cladobotryum mycophilum TaxID=491253 RepID=A0ABR0SM21_9HYPO